MYSIVYGLCIFILFTPNASTLKMINNHDAEAIAKEASNLAKLSAKSMNSETADALETEDPNENLIHILENVPNPYKTSQNPITKLDPNLFGDENSCDRDYTVPCPEHFIVTRWKNTSSLCAPLPQYTGSCQDSIEFMNNDSDIILKRQFSSSCRVECERDFSQPCPNQFTVQSSNMCYPSKVYKGPCSHPVSFWMHNPTMIESWSVRCKAYFPCLTTSTEISSTKINKVDSIRRVTGL
ncbi:uncharacterized protein LOC128884359 isoform X2 [Hylaeus volcanicus]|uniref:uncharacterized protein LOC128884359 isoform X2 n=1 Tax=Hylaeus volcanicus TaxID=313075 RepID=UPI0023B7C8E8|nr:uncharacterized protein LOC128884359 isoform X2 [Hylaeus volcanicus]